MLFVARLLEGSVKSDQALQKTGLGKFVVEARPLINRQRVTKGEGFPQDVQLKLETHFGGLAQILFQSGVVGAGVAQPGGDGLAQRAILPERLDDFTARLTAQRGKRRTLRITQFEFARDGIAGRYPPRPGLRAEKCADDGNVQQHGNGQCDFECFHGGALNPVKGKMSERDGFGVMRSRAERRTDGDADDDRGNGRGAGNERWQAEPCLPPGPRWRAVKWRC